MLRLAALGVLQSEPLNGYRLMQQLEFFMSCCISVNSGAIYPLLKRMEEQREVTLLPDVAEAGQAGKTYEITSLGRERWRQLMLTHPQESWVNARSRFAIKVFFFSHLESAERLQLLEHRLMQCQLRLAHRQSQPQQLDGYRAAVWQRSLDVIESEIQWLTQQLAREQSLSDFPNLDSAIVLSLEDAIGLSS
ncbi:MAG: PadR family transcriptional regulator [Lyngbya sp. HA4199-MV5]|jgi:DNA-binding PadR family transcriptional regulator|nr:PadR family transcriptional regulator [Lyngbya sp. HA4199-MV5]